MSQKNREISFPYENALYKSMNCNPCSAQDGGNIVSKDRYELKVTTLICTQCGTGTIMSLNTGSKKRGTKDFLAQT